MQLLSRVFHVAFSSSKGALIPATLPSGQQFLALGDEDFLSFVWILSHPHCQWEVSWD